LQSQRRARKAAYLSSETLLHAAVAGWPQN
jgi:hypothetical protein